MSVWSLSLLALAIFGVLSEPSHGPTRKQRRQRRRESDLGPALQRRWLRRP